MSKPTYDQFINGDNAYIKQIARALEQARGGWSETDLAHFFYAMYEEGRSIDWILKDIWGDRYVPPAHEQATGDLLTWPRRGCSLYNSFVDTAWDCRQFATILNGSGMTMTTAYLLSAQWSEQVNDLILPFAKRPDGLWDLHDWQSSYFERLSEYVATMNAKGIVVILNVLELYSWSDRKRGLPGVPDPEQGPWRHNVNGVRWADDHAFDILPDQWLTEFILRAVAAVEGMGVVFRTGNEMPEKPMHFRIASVIRSVWQDAKIICSRQEDTPGQYFNMQVGTTLDGIEFHGWRDLSFLKQLFDDEPADRPETWEQFFDKKDSSGRSLNVDFRRVIASSDGARASTDPVNTYDWPNLLKVAQFCIGKGCGYDHQSRSKMVRIQTGRADLSTIETDFLEQLARL